MSALFTVAPLGAAMRYTTRAASSLEMKQALPHAETAAWTGLYAQSGTSALYWT